MNKNANRDEQMVVALGVVGCELHKETRIRRRRNNNKKKDRGKKKLLSPHEVKSANSFGLGGEVCVCVRGFHDRTGWQVMAD